MDDILSSLFLISSDLINLGAKVLDVLDCRCRELFRRWPGSELKELLGENELCRSWRCTGVGEFVLKTAERGRADGEMGEANGISKDLLEGWLGEPPWNEDTALLVSWMSIGRRRCQT